MSPQDFMVWINAGSLIVMTLIAIDTWYVDRFKKPKKKG